MRAAFLFGGMAETFEACSAGLDPASGGRPRAHCPCGTGLSDGRRQRYSGPMEKAEGKHRPTDASPAFSEDGVDLTLIRWMLSLSVDERLELLEEHAGFVGDLRRANHSLQVPPHPRGP
jgi:hypothetical protein